MSRSHIGAASVALACGIALSCYMVRVPDLPLTEAAKIISRAPEFNRYARLAKVEAVDHMKPSMDSVSHGQFTFLYLNSPSDAPPIKAQADFRYIEGKWPQSFRQHSVRRFEIRAASIPQVALSVT